MTRAALIVVVAVGTACGASPPTGPLPTAAGPTPPAPIDAAAPVAVAPPGPCRADAQHCCTAAGALVVPGGCQPDYPGGVQPATRRGDDGRCVPVECFLRCLPPDAQIATPTGAVAVATLRAGDLVWTADAAGARVAAPIVLVRAVPIDGVREVLALTLTDGRRVRASAGHPLASGGLVGAATIGTIVDGAAVTAIEPVSIRGATWDLLPAGPTGVYWADGVRLGSTLAARRH